MNSIEFEPAHVGNRQKALRIAIDIKNLALYSGGIASFFGPLLAAWLKRRPDHDFTLVGPRFDTSALEQAAHWRQHTVPWPEWVPRALRHPIYDNLLFPRAMREVQPDLVFTPYHDVRLPAEVPSVMMVHDTCLHDLPDVYPLRIRGYYLHMLRRNLKKSVQVLTVSQTSRRDLMARYGVTDEQSGIVPNSIDPRMTGSATASAQAAVLRSARPPGLHLFYPGGSDHRKNIRRLSLVLAQLDAMGHAPNLWITGSLDPAWTACLADHPVALRKRFNFLGRISVEELAAQYLACDVVVYPTLCEGFGRVALEAMELGAPLACSDLEVLREVAADYPVYFNPREAGDMTRAVLEAQYLGRQQARLCPDFQPEAVIKRFLYAMDTVIDRVRGGA
jgi:glycosyltransferase involved in cell wall biosynthesis